MVAGSFLLADSLIECADTEGHVRIPLDMPSHAAFDALHGFGWLDDLAAVGDLRARALAQQTWADWMARHGRGQGGPWAPGLTGQRLIHWLVHAPFLMQAQPRDVHDRFLRALSHHAAFLEKRAGAASSGLPQIAARMGVLLAALALDGWQARIDPALQALLRVAETQIAPDGGIASRAPEDLMQVFVLLTWAARCLEDAGLPVPDRLRALLGRAASALRVLRHADGGLARFHGGGRGQESDLVTALATFDALQRDPVGLAGGRAMGFARLAAGRTTVLVDAAPPPGGAHAGRAHASTLAFELTSNRRPLIVSCGDGRFFSEEWHRASRASASHSTLSLDGFSSARFASGDRARLDLRDGPQSVTCDFRNTAWSRVAALSHDGYLASHGLEHARLLDLSADGRVLTGEDMLLAPSPAARKRFDNVSARLRGQGIAYTLRFHLHPDADASVDMNGAAVSIVLRSGEVWVFRAGGLALQLQPSVYLEKGRLHPRPSLQIVLPLRATDYTSAVTWTLAKAQDTPLALRDLTQDDPLGPASA
jgi:uncharacterized heparinase superfamily protein